MNSRTDARTALQDRNCSKENDTMPTNVATVSETDVMRDLDREYRERSGLGDRRHYSIFYSRISQSPLMILGINPGGDPARWSMPVGADEFCSEWQHDYVDERYEIQAVMQPLLRRVLRIDDSVLRRIPKTNMIFRRSQGVSRFRDQQSGMTMDAALREAAPTLEKIIRRVSPKAIIFEGLDALAMFNRTFGRGALSASLVAPVTTPNGRHPALIYSSKYARRKEFEVAEADMMTRLEPIGAVLREMGAPPGR
jgi:hypothetical protein